MKRSGNSKEKGRDKRERSREQSYEKAKKEIKEKEGKKEIKEKKQKKQKKTEKDKQNKINIPIYDDSNLIEPMTIQDYINNTKQKLITQNINLETYINMNDVDHEQIFIYLANIINNDLTKFFKLYQTEFFKLTLNERILLQNKFINKKNIDIPDLIKKNIIKETKIEKIFINILKGLVEIKNVTLEKIENIFLKNKVYFDEEIDIKIPYKYGTKELKYYSLLSDLFFYFHFTNKQINDLFNIFSHIKIFINKIKEGDEHLILKFNYLFNILYMYLHNNYIDQNIFIDIVTTCLSFDKEKANEVFKKFQEIIGDAPICLINGIPIKKYKGKITGNEIISYEYPSLKIKFQTLTKNINWYAGDKLHSYLVTEDYMLVIRFPENCKFNYFSMEEIGTQVDNFFNHIIHSAPMKQAMIIDDDACKYKYFFNNDSILKEFNDNVHLVPLPFHNYHGFTDKKSFDIYINVSYKINGDFLKVLKKYNNFFISKAHEFKHASRIYLRLYNNKVSIKTPIKDIKKLKGKSSYLKEIFNKTHKNLKILSIITNQIQNNNKESKIEEYGDLLELSLFGYKLDTLFLKTVCFCLSESSWALNPEQFYDNFSKTVMDNKVIKLKDSCKENFLNFLLKFFDFTEKYQQYSNMMISKDSDASSKNAFKFISIERLSHYDLRDINRGRSINELITIEEIKENKRKMIEQGTVSEDSEDDDDENVA